MSTLRLTRPLVVLRLSRFSALVAGLVGLARSRKGLARLDDHLLRDIGVTRDEAVAEASRAPWDPPLHWKA